MNLCRLMMIAVMLYNTNNVDDDMLNKWCLYTIEMMLKSRLMNIIDCHDDDIINKCVQVINSTVKECRDLLSLMYYKIIRNFLLNWVAQFLKCLVRYITHDSYAISVVPPFNRLWAWVSAW